MSADTWDTGEARRWLGNDERLYFQALELGRSLDASGLSEKAGAIAFMEAFSTLPGVDTGAVDWLDVAEDFRDEVDDQEGEDVHRTDCVCLDCAERRP